MAIWLPVQQAATQVVALADARALDAEVVGSKAAALAASRRAGLPVLDGFVVPAAAAPALPGREAPRPLRAAWDGLSDGGRRPVVVRSSSPVEDTATSSAAGRFTSVVGVLGWEAFVDAVAAVVASAGGVPMAVLVQPHLDPAVSGVAFGVDPVSGRHDRLVVAAVTGGPQRLVAGEVGGDRYVLGRRGRLLGAEPGDGGTELGRRRRRALAALARSAATVHGGPQDLEWAFTEAGDAVLLQSRPVTAVGERPSGPRFGRGPVAETFPAALAPLERDLWLAPLRAALIEAVVLTGRASRRRAEAGAVVVAPGGWVAVDLDLLEGTRPGLWGRLDPRPRWRRLAAAWRVGRLGAALGDLAADVVAAADDALERVPRLDGLGDDALVDLLDRAGAVLRSLHGHEILAGVLRPAEGATAAEVALHALASGRRDGLDDGDLAARAPEVLALTAPRVGGPDPLPPGGASRRPVGIDALGEREALRLRVRWVHELTARAADELGRRLATRGVLADPGDVRLLGRSAVVDGLRGAVVVPEPDAPGPPPPVEFRLTPSGDAVAVGRAGGDGVAAGGGRGAGPVHVGDDPPPGAVLVVDVLDPRLAPALPHLAGLVAESGSPLSHLAILAREHGVPTVVGVAGARGRWHPGQVVVVDGTGGDVTPLDDTVAVGGS